MAASRKRIWLIVMATAAVAIAGTTAGAGIAWSGEIRELLESARDATSELLLKVPPVLYFLAFALAPAFGFPITLFYLSAAAVLGGLLPGLLLTWLALAINIAVGYWLASDFLRPVITRLIRSRGYEIPEADPENHRPVIVVTRLSPLPFAIQNWVLGIARLPFGLYLAYSLPIQAFLGTGVILLGDSLLSGHAGLALLGVFIIACTFLTVRIARKHYGLGESKKLKGKR